MDASVASFTEVLWIETQVISHEWQALYPPSHTLSLSLWVFAVLQGVADRVRDRDRASVHGSPVARACVAGEPILDHLLGHHVASSSLLALFTLGPDFIVVK